MLRSLGRALVRLPALLKLEGTARQAIDVARTRLLIGGCLFALSFAVIAVKLLYLGLAGEAAEPRTPAAQSVPPASDRADIVDRNGQLLATSLVTQSLYANPRQMLDAADAARRLARTLPGLNERELLDRFRTERAFVWVRRNLTPRQQAEVFRLGIPGLFFQREERRAYPYGALTGHMVGFTDIDNRGLAGVEQSLEERLRRDRARLELSIDIRAQHILREELTRQIAEFRAIGGSAIVMDVATAEILAMVSLPDFDANAPATASDDQRFNRNTLGLYEMGSTFKTFTIAMALDYATTTLTASYDARRPLEWGRYTINDYRGQGRVLTVPEVYQHSSNIGAARIALQVGSERQRQFLARLGLTRAPTLELPEVATPRAPNPWREINTITISYGHGMSVTPVNLLTAVAATVNGGIMRPATILRRPPGAAIPGERVMSQRTSEQMRRLMRLVVERGSGRAAAAPGYLVGGKTGTAEKIRGRGYSENARISSFVGAFPINAPRYAVLVMLDEPHATQQTQGQATGGWVAAPLVGRLVPRLAALWNIPPVNEDEPLVREQLALQGVPVRRR